MKESLLFTYSQKHQILLFSQTEAVIYDSWVLFIYVFLQIDDSTFQKVNLTSVLLF